MSDRRSERGAARRWLKSLQSTENHMREDIFPVFSRPSSPRCDAPIPPLCLSPFVSAPPSLSLSLSLSLSRIVSLLSFARKRPDPEIIPSSPSRSHRFATVSSNRCWLLSASYRLHTEIVPPSLLIDRSDWISVSPLCFLSGSRLARQLCFWGRGTDANRGNFTFPHALFGGKWQLDRVKLASVKQQLLQIKTFKKVSIVGKRLLSKIVCA